MRRVLIVGIAAFVAVAAWVILVRAGGAGGPPSGSSVRASQGTREGLGLLPRTVEAGGVTVLVEPVRIDGSGAVFLITLDTHTVELTADLGRTARLDVDGVGWGPVRWVGDPPGGHHRGGELRFGASGPAEGEARLTLGGLPEPVEVRWSLEA